MALQDFIAIDVTGSYSNAEIWSVFDDAGYLTSTEIMRDTDAASELVEGDTPRKRLLPPGEGVPLDSLENSLCVSDEGWVRFPDGLRLIPNTDYDEALDGKEVYASAAIPGVEA